MHTDLAAALEVPRFDVVVFLPVEHAQPSRSAPSRCLIRFSTTAMTTAARSASATVIVLFNFRRLASAKGNALKSKGDISNLRKGDAAREPVCLLGRPALGKRTLHSLSSRPSKDGPARRPASSPALAAEGRRGPRSARVPSGRGTGARRLGRRWRRPLWCACRRTRGRRRRLGGSRRWWGELDVDAAEGEVAGRVEGGEGAGYVGWAFAFVAEPAVVAGVGLGLEADAGAPDGALFWLGDRGPDVFGGET